MSEEGKNKLVFQNHHKQQPAPSVIYTDFEALIFDIDGPKLDTTKSTTQKKQQHDVCIYCYMAMWCDGQTDGVQKAQRCRALRAIHGEEHWIKAVLAHPHPMNTTWEDWQAYSSTTNCYICENPLKSDSVHD